MELDTRVHFKGCETDTGTVTGVSAVMDVTTEVSPTFKIGGSRGSSISITEIEVTWDDGQVGVYHPSELVEL